MSYWKTSPRERVLNEKNGTRLARMLSVVLIALALGCLVGALIGRLLIPFGG